jgi:DNA-binding NtrC family response regulator
LSNGSEITPNDILFDDESSSFEDSSPSATTGSYSSLLLEGATLADVEREVILSALHGSDGNRTHAAQTLGISVRTLRNRIREYRQLGILVPEPGMARRIHGL